MRLATPAGECELRTRLIGGFNAYNLMAVVAVLTALGEAPAEMERIAAGLRPAPGRMEVYGGEGAPLVVVDYAHTPDALKQVLTATREHVDGRLWCVFGCGGDRDRGKRPLMGAVAETLADGVILTDDNPRHEDGDAIVKDILNGMKTRPEVIRDREAAIRRALEAAKKADAVVIAGKGHETTQLIGDEPLPFSDARVVEEWLEQAA